MSQFGWTQKQLEKENTLKRIQEISEYNNIQNQIAKEEERKAKARN